MLPMPPRLACLNATPQPTPPHPGSQRYRFLRIPCADLISALGFHCLSVVLLACRPAFQPTWRRYSYLTQQQISFVQPR